MTNIARLSLALSVVTLVSLAPAANSADTHVVDDLGVRKGAPAHISLSTGFNGFAGAGIKEILVDGVPDRLVIGCSPEARIPAPSATAPVIAIATIA